MDSRTIVSPGQSANSGHGGLISGLLPLTKDDQEFFAQMVRLPHAPWQKYWDGIFVEGGIKNRLVGLLQLQHTFGKSSFDPSVLASHRAVILYGPPGTGKSTLARGAAQQSALFHRERGCAWTLFIEVNSYSLSSSWQGEGPKLVEKTFKRIFEYASAGQPVIVLIDEAESLFSNRAMTLNGTNPADVFRTANAGIQQMDRLLEGHRNVSLIATTNLPRATEGALWDRGDLAVFVGLPPASMRSLIFAEVFAALNDKLGTRIEIPNGKARTKQWKQLVSASRGFSGRKLRKSVLEAIVSSDGLVNAPANLTINDVVAVIKRTKRQEKLDQESGGIYDRFSERSKNV